MNTKLSLIAKAKQKTCLIELAKLVATGHHMGLDIRHTEGDFITILLYPYSDEAADAIHTTERAIRIDAGIWFDSGFYQDTGAREWSLDYCLEEKVEA